MFELPGGYQPEPGAPVLRSVKLRELTGAIENELCEITNEPVRSEAVSRQLSLLISQIGGHDADSKMISTLSVADRTYALAQLGVAHGYSHDWRSGACNSCDELFDFSVDLSTISPAQAPATYPEVHIHSSLGALIVRAPTGADQTAICNVGSDEQACRELLSRCLRAESGGTVDLDRLTKEDADNIEAAFDDLALGIPLMATAACPNCGSDNSFPFKIDHWLQRIAGDLFDQVHELALSYHWPEAEILSLSRDRRRNYLRRLGYFDEVGQP